MTLLRTGARQLATAVLFPTGHVPGSRRLPVLLDPYGGPGHPRVVAASGAFLSSQWFSDQGYAVTEAARHLGRKATMLGRWKREVEQTKNGAFPGNGRGSLDQEA